MKTTIDSAGRLVIPKEIRQQAGIKPGMPLEVRWREGRIEIEPAPLPVELMRKDHLLVAVPQEDVGSLTEEAVEETRVILRKEYFSKSELMISGASVSNGGMGMHTK